MQSEFPWQPRVVAWELTRRCHLHCRHCRAGAEGADVEEAERLSRDEAMAFLDDLASLGPGVLILTGGDPMLHPDFLAYAQRAHQGGRRVVAAVCAGEITSERIQAMQRAGISALSLSLDAADAASHDAFRGQQGAFAGIMDAAACARAAGMRFQINTTVHRANVAELPALDALVRSLGASIWDLFLLVPTGRAAGLADYALTPAVYERSLAWALQRAREGSPPLALTCAPRYAVHAAAEGLQARACLGGKSFAFVSHSGRVQICGFLPLQAGDLRQQSFSEIWQQSPLFQALRRPQSLHQGCQSCAHVQICGGCRARAYAASGDHLAADPSCPRTLVV